MRTIRQLINTVVNLPRLLPWRREVDRELAEIKLMFRNLQNSIIDAVGNKPEENRVKLELLEAKYICLTKHVESVARRAEPINVGEIHVKATEPIPDDAIKVDIPDHFSTTFGPGDPTNGPE
jgi:hypothetical protein